MMLRVISAGHHFHTVQEGEPLPDLAPRLKSVCRERYRRVDRFVELSLLGSGLCVQGQTLKPDCGLYLASGFGPMGSNLAVQEQLFRDREPPKPYDFVNTLGTSAGFHVAKDLGLKGPNLFIARRGASLEAALAAVQVDMKLGIVSQALLGVVEEVTLPLDQHRQRHGLPAGTLVAEGSHWLLLEKGEGAGKPLRFLSLKDETLLTEYLLAYGSVADRHLFTLDSEAQFAAALGGNLFAPAFKDAGIHDSQQAAWVAEFVVSGTPGSLFIAHKASHRSPTLLHLGP